MTKLTSSAQWQNSDWSERKSVEYSSNFPIFRESDFADLPSQPKPVISHSHHENKNSLQLYALTEVYHKALKVHGSSEALEAHRRPLVAMRKELTDAERMRMRMRVETTNQHKGADRVVAIAFTLNLCDMAMKVSLIFKIYLKIMSCSSLLPTWPARNHCSQKPSTVLWTLAINSFCFSA